MNWRLLILLLCTPFCGCASYKLGAVSDPGFQTMYVENFKSDVDEPGLETIVTTTIIREFQREGTIQITDREKAEVIMQGHITTFETTPVRYSRANEITPIETQMSLGVEYTLTRNGSRKTFKKGAAAGQSNFFIGNDLQSDKRQGAPLAAERLGRNLVSSLVDGW